jgi:hypothetical protein
MTRRTPGKAKLSRITAMLNRGEAAMEVGDLFIARSTAHPGSKPWFRHRTRPERVLAPATACVPPRARYHDPLPPSRPMGSSTRRAHYAAAAGYDGHGEMPEMTPAQYRRYRHKLRHQLAAGHITREDGELAMAQSVSTEGGRAAMTRFERAILAANLTVAFTQLAGMILEERQRQHVNRLSERSLALSREAFEYQKRPFTDRVRERLTEGGEQP